MGLWCWVTSWGSVDVMGHLSACVGWVDGSRHGHGGSACSGRDGFQLGCYGGCGLFRLDVYAYFHDINSYIWWVVCEPIFVSQDFELCNI